MKNLALLGSVAVCLLAAACSRAKEPAAATPPPNLRADADRLQQAINKAAEQRKQQTSPAPAATP